MTFELHEFSKAACCSLGKPVHFVPEGEYAFFGISQTVPFLNKSVFIFCCISDLPFANTLTLTLLVPQGSLQRLLHMVGYCEAVGNRLQCCLSLKLNPVECPVSSVAPPCHARTHEIPCDFACSSVEDWCLYNFSFVLIASWQERIQCRRRIIAQYFGGVGAAEACL